MKDSIFREYDIRGKIDSELVIDEIYDLTRSIAYYFNQENSRIKTVAVGMDGRISSPALKMHMISALQESGLDVIDIGMCPTPVLYFALAAMPIDAGLMITASHNPADYNGIKISLGTRCIWGSQIREIRDLYHEKKILIASKRGIVTHKSIIPLYIAWLRDHFRSLINMDLPVAIDCGNGAGSTVLPGLIAVMNWKNVQSLCCTVDGNYPHHEADPTVEKNMYHVKHALQITDAVLGIGLDGDGDRMAAMTKSGFLVPGDQLLAIFAQEVLKEMPGSPIVFDVKASAGLIEILQKWGAKPCISPCGHAIVKDQMDKEHAPLAGELSCHFFFKDRYFGYDDGIYAMMRLFEIIKNTGKSLDQLLHVFPKKYSSREIRIESAESDKQVIIEYLKKYYAAKKDVHLLQIDGVRITMPYGWALVRPSNTQPVLSMRFEGNSTEDLKKIKEEIAHVLSHFFDKEQLKKELEQ